MGVCRYPARQRPLSGALESDQNRSVDACKVGSTRFADGEPFRFLYEPAGNPCGFVLFCRFVSLFLQAWLRLVYFRQLYCFLLSAWCFIEGDRSGRKEERFSTVFRKGKSAQSSGSAKHPAPARLPCRAFADSRRRSPCRRQRSRIHGCHASCRSGVVLFV